MSPSFQARDQARRAGRQAPDRCIRHRAMRTKFRVSCHAPGKSEYTLNPEFRRKFPKWRPAVACSPNQSSRGLSTASMARSEEHTSELQSLMRISYAVFCLKKKKK